VAKVINKNIQQCDVAQACTVWDRALNVWKKFQNVPPLLMHIVHAIAVETPSMLAYQLTLSVRTGYIYSVASQATSLAPFKIFIQQISIMNILNMLHNLRFSLFKMPFIS
jgi:hypothetical protein